MRPALTKTRAVTAALLLAGAAAGCNAFGITGEDDNEVRVTILALGASSLDADDNHTYVVTADTEYEGAGLNGFDDLAVGDVVEIEWEPISGGDRRALEIETGSHDDAGDDD